MLTEIHDSMGHRDRTSTRRGFCRAVGLTSLLPLAGCSALDVGFGSTGPLDLTVLNYDETGRTIGFVVVSEDGLEFSATVTLEGIDERPPTEREFKEIAYGQQGDRFDIVAFHPELEETREHIVEMECVSNPDRDDHVLAEIAKTGHHVAFRQERC